MNVFIGGGGGGCRLFRPPGGINVSPYPDNNYSHDQIRNVLKFGDVLVYIFVVIYYRI